MPVSVAQRLSAVQLWTEALPSPAGMRKAAGPKINATMALSRTAGLGGKGCWNGTAKRLGQRGGAGGNSQRLTSIQPCLQWHYWTL